MEEMTGVEERARLRLQSSSTMQRRIVPGVECWTLCAGCFAEASVKEPSMSSNMDFNDNEEGREELEGEILAMLKTLEPVPIEMDETVDGRYHWSVGSSIGDSPLDFVRALKDAIEAAMQVVISRRYDLPPQ